MAKPTLPLFAISEKYQQTESAISTMETEAENGSMDVSSD
jgi:hypothetical protein